MSSALTVDAISFDLLQQVAGSNDRDLIGAIGSKLERYLSQIDRLWDRDDLEVLACLGAVAQSLNGTSLSPHLGYLYGYAFGAACAYLGRTSQCPCDQPGVGLDYRGRRVFEKPGGFGQPLGPGHWRWPDRHPDPRRLPFHRLLATPVILSALEAIRRVDLVGQDHEMIATITQMRG